MNAWLSQLTDDSLVNLFWFALVYSTLIGTIVGSFLNVCIYRIPLEQSVVSPGSHCFSCGNKVPWFCNIPILSWLALRGKCFYCKAEISPRYLFVEALTGIFFLLAFMRWANPNLMGMTPSIEVWSIPYLWIILSTWILGTFVDFDHYIIPNRVTLGGMVIGLVGSALLPEFHDQTVWFLGLRDSAIGLAVGFGLLYGVGILGKLIFKRDAMGFGDVKWLGAMGALLGWQGTLFILVGSSFVGSIVGITLMLMRKAEKSSMIPFGPYLAIAAMVYLFWGKAIIAGYINLIMPPAL